ncbi:MAG: GH3 auxin-responsive promoter family protein [Firmicutes bacterium]|nr:GH3 auxin-responsive promoter family protein [Bacillota bacterium]
MRRKGVESRKGLIAYFEQMTFEPMEVQKKLLMELLEENKNTEYGKKYGFDKINSIEEYQNRVPVTEYDDYTEYIDRMTNDGEEGLISNKKPVWYNKTSGTVGEPKKIPYTQATRDRFNRYSLGFQSAILYKEIGEKYFGGRFLNLIRCGGVITKLPDGTPFGPISEASLRPYIDRWEHIYSVPSEATFAPKGTDTGYLNARYALCDKDINNINCSFTGFLLDFCRYIEKNRKLLVNDIEKGIIDESIELPDDIRKKLTANLTPMPERAAQLKSIFEEGFESPFIPKVWKKLSYVVGGASAGFARYTKEIRERYLGDDIAFYYRGISASEGIFTVPLGLAANESALIPDSLFYEFISLSDENAQPVTMDKLETGKEYELVITNHSGFYRYRMKDVMRVTGFHNSVPLVEFLYRIDKTVSLMGEKTTELALRTAAERTAAECGFLLLDSSVYPDTDEVRYVYIMEIDRVPSGLTEEKILACLENNLSQANPSYGEKIQSGLIKPAKLLFAQPETYVLYKEMMLMKGNSVAQLKPVTVIGNEDQKKFFFALTESFDNITKSSH